MNSSKSLLTIIDSQNSFLSPNGLLYVKDSNFLIDAINNYLKANANKFNTILYTLDTHFTEEYPYSEEAKEFPIHCVYNTQDWQLAVTDNINNASVYKLHKNTFNMWSSSKINSAMLAVDKNYQVLGKVKPLNSLNKTYENINNFVADYIGFDVYICGIALDYCVKYAVDGYLANGFQVRLISQLTHFIHNNIKEVFSAPQYAQYLKTKQLQII